MMTYLKWRREILWKIPPGFTLKGPAAAASLISSIGGLCQSGIMREGEGRVWSKARAEKTSSLRPLLPLKPTPPLRSGVHRRRRKDLKRRRRTGLPDAAPPIVMEELLQYPTICTRLQQSGNPSRLFGLLFEHGWLGAGASHRLLSLGGSWDKAPPED